MTEVPPPPPPKRRGPGRPPKNDKKKRLQRLGIVNEPSNADKTTDIYLNAVELMYENPQLFKKLFSLFKVYNVELIHVCFDVDRLFMYAVDHTGDVTINIEILGAQMNRYYVESPINIDLDTSQFHKIFQVIGKDFTRIIFMSNRKNKNTRIGMLFMDEDKNVSKYSIELNDVKEGKITLEQVREKFDNARNYPVSFELDFKFLKNKISEMNNLSKKFILQQDMTRPDAPMCFKAISDDNKIDNISPISNRGKANFINTYKGNLFIAPVFVNHIRPFANSTISDIVQIMADDKSDIVFKAKLDLDDTTSSKVKLENSEKGYVFIASKLAFTNE